MRNGIWLLDGIPNGIDVGIVGLVRFVDRDPTTGTRVQAGPFCQSDIGTDADGPDHEIRSEDATVDESHSLVFHRGQCGARLDVDTVSGELVTNQYGQFWVEGSEYLWRGLDDSDVDSLSDQIFGHLQTDEPGADDDGGGWSHIHVGCQSGRVFDRAQRADPVIPGNRGAYWGRSHAEDKLVVGNDSHLAGDGLAGGHAVCNPVDRNHLVVDSDIEPESVEELLGV